jgi:hypothetical protein
LPAAGLWQAPSLFPFAQFALYERKLSKPKTIKLLAAAGKIRL